jgi:hypothetical protein
VTVSVCVTVVAGGVSASLVVGVVEVLAVVADFAWSVAVAVCFCVAPISSSACVAVDVVLGMLAAPPSVRLAAV